MSGYTALLQRMREEHVLYSVLLELTYRCNLDCAFCYNDLGLRGRQLEVEGWERLLDDLAQMQVMEVALSGGEPLASPSFWPVGRRARELGFVVRLKSNGHALRGEIARRIRDEIDPWAIDISLHGARPESHDRQTRIAGSFDRLLANLGEMSRLGLRITLRSTLTRWNEAEVDAMFALADRLGLGLEFDPVVTPRDNGDHGPLELAATDAGLAHLYRVVAERQHQRRSAAQPPRPEIGRHQDAGVQAPTGLENGARKNCGTGASTLTIDPFGNVYPCVQWRRRIGNLHTRSVAEIWHGSPELAEVRALNEEAGRRHAALGIGGAPAGFCLGLAAQLEGDPLALYPALERQLRVFSASAAQRSLPILSR